MVRRGIVGRTWNAVGRIERLRTFYPCAPRHTATLRLASRKYRPICSTMCSTSAPSARDHGLHGPRISIADNLTSCSPAFICSFSTTASAPADGETSDQGGSPAARLGTSICRRQRGARMSSLRRGRTVFGCRHPGRHHVPLEQGDAFAGGFAGYLREGGEVEFSAEAGGRSRKRAGELQHRSLRFRSLSQLPRLRCAAV